MYKNNNYYRNKRSFSHLAQLVIRYTILSFSLVLAGCAKHVYEAAPIDTVELLHQQSRLKPDSDGFRQFLQQHLPNSEFPVASWHLPSLTLAALYFNPALQVAKKDLAIMDAELMIAGQKINPKFNLPLEYRTEPRGSPWLLGMVGGFIYERPEKRQAKINIAQANRSAGEMALHQLAWTLYQDIHLNFIDYYTQVETGKTLLSQKALLNEILSLLQQRLEFGQASEFELSQARLELQRIELALSNQNFKTNDSLYRLFSHTGLLPINLINDEFNFKDLEEYLANDTQITNSLNQANLSNRFDFKYMLSQYEVFENELKLEIEKQYPDINLSPGFIYEQGDNIWQLGAAWVLPIFHNNDGQIMRALANREKKQLEILQLQNQLLQKLERRKQNYQDKVSAYRKSILLLESQQQRTIEIEKQHELGYQDKLSVIRARFETEKTKEAIFSMSVSVMQSAVILEDIIQAPLLSNINLKQWVETLIQVNKPL